MSAMTETEFNCLADRVFALVGEAIDAAEGDIDWTLNEGVLEIECPDRSKLILSRHTPNRELWLAAKSGGYHYRLDGEGWHNTRGGDDLRRRLAQSLREQAGTAIDLPVLPHAV